MIKFGTGGWRAFIGEDFTKENVKIMAQAVANMMKKQKCDKEGFVIGYDRRFLSDKAARWIAEVLAANGIKVFFHYEGCAYSTGHVYGEETGNYLWGGCYSQ